MKKRSRDTCRRAACGPLEDYENSRLADLHRTLEHSIGGHGGGLLEMSPTPRPILLDFGYAKLRKIIQEDPITFLEISKSQQLRLSEIVRAIFFGNLKCGI